MENKLSELLDKYDKWVDLDGNLFVGWLRFLILPTLFSVVIMGGLVLCHVKYG